MTPTVEILGVPGLPEIAHGDDLAALVADASPALRDGDIVVVTSKVVSKAEGRIRRAAPGDDLERMRDDAITAETVRVVARRGPTRIVQTAHGFVMAAAGVDESNTPDGTIVLLPLDPDASARSIRAGLRERLGVTVGVVVTDTFGRPWRVGQTDVALGAAGVTVVDDHRGRTDAHGRPLLVTEIAIADEVAAAADLVKGKSTGVPVAVVRGLAHHTTSDDGPGVRALVRPSELDMFSLGARDVVSARRTVREFTGEPIGTEPVRRAIAAAVTAPAAYASTPWRFVLVESAAARSRLLDALETHWADPPGETERAESVDVLCRAPVLVVPCVDRSALRHADDAAEVEMATLSAGAAVENLLVALAVEQLGSAWIASTLYCRDATRTALDLPPHWDPMGTVAIGRPAKPVDPRDRDPDPYLETR